MGTSFAFRTLLRDLSRLLGGSMAGYAVLLIASPMITRLFSPAEFGLFAVFSGFVAVASVFMTSGFEMGIVSAGRRVDAFRHFVMAINSAILAVPAFFALIVVAAAFGVPLGLPFWAMSLAVISCFLASLATISVAWAVKFGKISQAARINFVSLSLRSIGQIGFGLFGFGVFGLIAGEVFGRAIAAISSQVVAIWRAAQILVRAPGRALKRMVAARDYLLFYTPSVAIDTALVWLPAPLFALLFDPYVAGLVALVQRFASVPLTLANQSLGQIFHQRASGMYRSNPISLRRFVLGVALAVLPMAVGVAAGFLVFGSALMSAIFGAQWAEAGFVAAALVPLFYAQFLAILGTRLLLVREMLRFKLMSSAVHLLVLICVLGGAYQAGLPWQTALITLSFCLCLSYLIALLVALWDLGAKV